MSLTSLTLALLVMAQSPAPAGDVVPINKRNFKIPILIEPSKRAQIKLLKLYVSADQGKNWSEAAVRTPDQDHFAYYAPADGVYWFTVAVVDQKDHQQPSDPYKVAPNQKILVDSQPPDVKITRVERQGDEVLIGWEIREENPELESLRLEYRAADAPPSALWYAVPIGRDLSGVAKVHADHGAGILVRVEMKDQAGNVGTAQKEVPPAAAPPERITTASLPPPAPVPMATPPAGPPPGSPLTAGGAPGGTLPSEMTQPAPRADVPPPAPLPATRVEAWPSMERGPVPPPLSGRPAEATQRVVAWSPNTDPGPAATAGAGPMPYHGPLPNVAVVSDPQVNLEYEVKTGPSGIKKVELFITEDDGKTWAKFAEDDDKKSPIGFRLPREGLFGFRLVITSGADLSDGPPAPGTPPEIRIELDMTPPVVQLYEPKGDPLRPDTLILSWTATDHNIADRPVTLEYAEADGHWVTIATGQPATGTYSWQLPRPLAYVHLRASAVDIAGNRSVAQTVNPQLVDLNKPKGRILGLAPIGKKPAEMPAPGPVPVPR
jgi:hypothetical protein